MSATAANPATGTSAPAKGPDRCHGNDLRLRAGVRLHDGGPGALLVDDATGLRLALGEDAASVLRALPALAAPRTGAVEAFLAGLSALGLFEPTDAREAARAQGRYVLEQAHQAERARVRSTVARAKDTVPLHRERLSALIDRDPGWELEDLPVLGREDIRRHFPAGLTPAGLDVAALLRSQDLVIATTSGTTGARLQVYSDTRIPRLPDDVLARWRLARSEEPRGAVRTVVLTSPACSESSCSSRLERERRVSFEHTLFVPSPRNPFRMSEDEVRRTVAEMRDFGADLWLVNPVYLAELARRAARLNIPLPRPRAVVASYQFLSHCQRRTIESHVGAPVFSLYSATELAGSQVAVSCAEGNLHVWLEQSFVELLRGGRPVGPSEVGSVTVTTHNETTPLVRYALGDLARVRLAPCACDVGSAWPTLVLEGRERDAFVVDGAWVTTKAVDDAIAPAQLALYQLSETGKGRYRLDAIPGAEGAGARGWRDAAEVALRALLAPEDLVLREVSELPLDESRKFRFTRPLASGGSAP